MTIDDEFVTFDLINKEILFLSDEIYFDYKLNIALLNSNHMLAYTYDGKVILYGDKITDSMQYVIDETDRRRKLQAEYNIKNNIQPKTIYKSIEEIKLTTSVADKNVDKHAEEKLVIDDTTLDGMESKETLEILKRKMLKYARSLQFEQAAMLRDKIKKIEEAVSYR